MVVRWWCDGGAMVVRWWCDGGAMVVMSAGVVCGDLNQ